VLKFEFDSLENVNHLTSSLSHSQEELETDQRPLFLSSAKQHKLKTGRRRKEGENQRDGERKTTKGALEKYFVVSGIFWEGSMKRRTHVMLQGDGHAFTILFFRFLRFP
jgi:hypothetical protein